MEGGTPIGDVGGIERRLEKFVLDQHAAGRGQVGVSRREPGLKALLAAAQAVLPGVVGAVGEPQAEQFASGAHHDLAALNEVVQRQLACGGRGVAQRAQPIGLVLEDVGVDGAHADAARLGVLAHRGIVAVLGLVPRDVQRHAAGDAGELVHRGGVIQFFRRGARRARPGKHLEARAGVGIAPRRGLDVLVLQRRLDRGHVDALGGKLVGEERVTGW